MNNSITLLEIIIELIPQYLEILKKKDSNNNSIVECTLNSETFFISSLRNNTSEMDSWLRAIEKLSSNLLNKNLGNSLVEKEAIQMEMINEWLKVLNYDADWIKLFNYSKQMDKRTNENSSIGFTFICNFDKKGTLDLINFNNQKLLDLLADSHYTFF